MKKKGKLLGDLVPVVTIAVLFAVILLTVVFSAVSYQRSVEMQDANNNARAVLSYVITAVRANAGGRVTAEERGGIPVLSIEDAGSGYEQQIFRNGGQLLESYGKTGTVPDPADALVIGETERFELNWIREDLLEIRTDAGNSYVHIRA